jgi:PhnB protein
MEIPMSQHAASQVDCPGGAIDAQAASKAGEVEVLGGVAPYLQLDGAAKAAKFYIRAFDAMEMGRAPPDEKGRDMHIHLYLNGGSLMLCDPFPEHGYPSVKPQGYTLHLQVDDVDPVWTRAVEAGCEVVVPVQRMFWGHRYGLVRDPFGVMWSIASLK